MIAKIAAAACIAALCAPLAAAQEIGQEMGQDIDMTAAVAEPAVPAPAVSGDRFAGKTVRAESLDGSIINTIYLDAGGVLRIYEEPIGPEHSGSWYVRDDKLCLEYEPRGRECWPDASGLQPETPATVESDRGVKAKITIK